MIEKDLPRIIAVDFDGTLFEDAWPEIGTPKMDVIRALKNEKAMGSKIILWTNRMGQYLYNAIQECAKYGIIFDAVNENLPEVIEAFGGDCRKIVATEFWDDRSVPIDILKPVEEETPKEDYLSICLDANGLDEPCLVVMRKLLDDSIEVVTHLYGKTAIRIYKILISSNEIKEEKDDLLKAKCAKESCITCEHHVLAYDIESRMISKFCKKDIPYPKDTNLSKVTCSEWHGRERHFIDNGGKG